RGDNDKVKLKLPSKNTPTETQQREALLSEVVRRPMNLTPPPPPPPPTLPSKNTPTETQQIEALLSEVVRRPMNLTPPPTYPQVPANRYSAPRKLPDKLTLSPPIPNPQPSFTPAQQTHPFLRHENENTTSTVSNAQTVSTVSRSPHHVIPRNPPRAPPPLRPPHPARRRLPLHQAVRSRRPDRHRRALHAPPRYIDSEPRSG
ncbi:hypothetical protein V495_04336, partial [Pseudogymnoascus sp. VKM F-4514 (FW-929)]